mmetsp:Transcript_771/g.1842  ORF Transcript_771/g.1842 Transcript_771/m.1842 type:complete len:200 (+) Transcript_771:63-662(+)
MSVYKTAAALRPSFIAYAPIAVLVLLPVRVETICGWMGSPLVVDDDGSVVVANNRNALVADSLPPPPWSNKRDFDCTAVAPPDNILAAVLVVLDIDIPSIPPQRARQIYARDEFPTSGLAKFWPRPCLGEFQTIRRRSYTCLAPSRFCGPFFSCRESVPHFAQWFEKSSSISWFFPVCASWRDRLDDSVPPNRESGHCQ